MSAVVAENAVKPTSIYSVTRVGRLQVIAHLSEPIPRYWLLDNDQLSGFVMNELNYGLRLAIEGKIITDINATDVRHQYPYQHPQNTHQTPSRRLHRSVNRGGTSRL